MPRTKSALLATGTLVAAGATALAVWGLLAPGNDGSRAAERGTVASPRPNRSGADRPRHAPTAGPVDAAKTNERVAAIVAALPKEAEAGHRESLGAELRNLLRRLGAERLDLVTKQQLLDLLATLDPDGRRLLIRAFGELEGDEATARRLLAIGRDKTLDAQTARVVFDAISRMHVPALLPDLLAMLDAGSRHAALVAGAIAACGGQAGGEALVARLTRSVSPSTRAAIVSVLGEKPDPRILPLVADHLAHTDPVVRGSLVELLGKARDFRFALRLGGLYHEEKDEILRLKILRALGRIGDRNAALFLLDIASRGGPAADQAVRALRDIRRPDAAEALAARWDQLAPPVRAAVMEAAARLAEPSAKLVAKAREALRDPDEATRIGAARVLGQSGREEHIKPLVDYLGHVTSARAGGVGLDALLRIGSPAAAKAVLAHLHVVAAEASKVYRLRAEQILARRAD